MIDRDDAMLIASRSPESAVLDRVVHRHLSEPATLLLAVSGGVDSTAMLLLAAAVVRRREPSHELVVGHVDHGVRAEAAEEAEAVATLADRLGIPMRHRRLETEGGGDDVASLRRRRWDALESMATSVDAAAILTAHHADDQAETLLLRLARGAGPAGLAGIPESRRTPRGILVLRPLLDVPRRALERLVEAVGVAPIRDPTNDRRDLARGMVRHEIMPRLERLHPGAARRMAAAARDLARMRTDGDREDATRWARIDCRRLGEDETATRVRAAARRRVGPSVDGVSRAVWRSVARAAVDEHVHPRAIDVVSGCRVEIDASDVHLSVQSPEPPA